MSRKIDWEGQIGRRLKLRDLHVFRVVLEHRSMVKAAAQLGVSQPAVSEVIADLEHALGVRLLDRSSQGVEPTMYGNALLKRSIAVFDELKQSVRDIEHLADPTSGEIRIACPLAMASTIIPQIFERFVQKYPRVVLNFDEVTPASTNRDFQDLRDRKYDLVLGRGGSLQSGEQSSNDLNIDVLFDDQLVIASGARSKWAARRSKIGLAELFDEPWIMQGPQTWNYRALTEACQASGLAMPGASLVTLSVSVITHFLAHGQFITAMPRSVAHFFSLKVLPVDLPVRPWPVYIATLKNRTLSPVVERFIEAARDFTRPMREGQPGAIGHANPRVRRRARIDQPALR